VDNIKCSSGSLRNVQLRGRSLVKGKLFRFFKLKTDNVEGTKNLSCLKFKIAKAWR